MAETSAEAWLLWHAGFAEREAATVPSVYDATKAGDCEALDAALDDLVAAFVVLNRDLNGDAPSASVGPGPHVPRSVAVAVSEINQLLRRYPGTNPGVKRGVWVVDAAWDAVLAGDVDDLAEHLSLEEHARAADQFDA